MSEPSKETQEEAVALVKSMVASLVREVVGNLAEELRDDLSCQALPHQYQILRHQPQEVCGVLPVRILVSLLGSAMLS